MNMYSVTASLTLIKSAAVKDFTSMDANAKVYGMVVTGGEQNTMIYFEPSEKMLAAMKQKAPRKIMEY